MKSQLYSGRHSRQGSAHLPRLSHVLFTHTNREYDPAEKEKGKSVGEPEDDESVTDVQDEAAEAATKRLQQLSDSSVGVSTRQVKRVRTSGQKMHNECNPRFQNNQN